MDVFFLFYVASQAANRAQCYDDDGKGEKMFKEQAQITWISDTSRASMAVRVWAGR